MKMVCPQCGFAVPGLMMIIGTKRGSNDGDPCLCGWCDKWNVCCKAKSGNLRKPTKAEEKNIEADYGHIRKFAVEAKRKAGVNNESKQLLVEKSAKTGKPIVPN